MPHHVHSVTDLLQEAAEALIRRDADRLYDLALNSQNWLQGKPEAAAQGRLLAAMIEAAELLHDEPSAIIQTEPGR